MVKRRHIFNLALSFLLLILLCTAFAFTWYHSYANKIVLPFYRKGNWLLVIVYAIFILLFFKIYKGFSINQLKRFDIISSQILALICVNIITYFQISLIARGLLKVVPILLLTLADIFISLFWTFFSCHLYRKLFPPRNLAIIYSSNAASTLVEKMSQRNEKYIITKSFNAEDENLYEEILKFDGVVICDVNAKSRNDIVKFCFKNSLRVYMSPKISDIIMRGAEDLHLFDSPLLLCKNQGLTIEQKIIKRLVDIIVSLFGIIILSPLFLIISMFIYSYDKGSVFYRQKRLTLNEKEFEVIKFRSMIVNAEKDGAILSTKNDNRITPIGKFIRKTRIDELPQLFNILKGEMSVVGPRPERPEFYNEYDENLPEFRYRLKIKAGLTGYAQVVGLYDTTPYDKLKLDLMYMENYSLLKDMHIIFLTAKMVLFPKIFSR
ncbi:MAG: exopolysaccharide biosynthesis polyprenyl glycosylphosphotransferase [Oscillospiraceae bacterium]|nr:exopolysaccharide biosynthesis polyprenyl glycosylphosphotransferase [Oscillospiraceae bacterium]